MNPSFEVHAVFVMEKLQMNLMQLKHSHRFYLDEICVELRDFFVRYIQIRSGMVHGDIKPRVALKKLIVDCK